MEVCPAVMTPSTGTVSPVHILDMPHQDRIAGVFFQDAAQKIGEQVSVAEPVLRNIEHFEKALLFLLHPNDPEHIARIVGVGLEQVFQGEGVGFPPLLRLLEGLFLAVFFLRGGFPVFLPPIICVFVFFEKAAFLPQAVVGLHQFAGQLAGVDAVVAAAHQRPEADFGGPAAQQARGHAFGCGVLPL